MRSCLRREMYTCTRRGAHVCQNFAVLIFANVSLLAKNGEVSRNYTPYCIWLYHPICGGHTSPVSQRSQA